MYALYDVLKMTCAEKKNLFSLYHLVSEQVNCSLGYYRYCYSNTSADKIRQDKIILFMSTNDHKVVQWNCRLQ